MKLDPVQEALVRICERRASVAAERASAELDGDELGFNYAAGIAEGLSIALGELETAGLPVASADFIATSGQPAR